MAKANVETANGTKITIDGTAAEVRNILEALNSRNPTHSVGAKQKSGKSEKTGFKKNTSKAVGVKGRIEGLISKGFFKQPKTIGDVKESLETMGHIYPTTHLSPSLIRLTRSGLLRRIKNDKNEWTYVNP